MGGFVKTTCEDYEYLMPCVSSIYTAGPGIDISSDNVISNTGVLSVNGQTGHVIIQAGDVTFSPYPNTFNTTGTTAEFLSSIASLNLPTGSAYLGQVSLSDMPEGVTVQGDVEVYVYPQNVIYAIMRSAEVEPYQWVADSYSNTHYGRGWMPVGNYVVESTTPSVAVEGMLWYDTTNNVVKVYDGTNWNEIGEGETYIAGTGIDITNNEISVDNTVAMTSDVNTKTFYLSGTSDLTTAQAAYDWYAAGKNAIVVIDGQEFFLAGAPDLAGYRLIPGINSYGTVTHYPFGDTTRYHRTWLQLIILSFTVTSISLNPSYIGSDIVVLDTNTDYVNPYQPQYNGSPATKKYVDDSISAITIPTYTAGTNITIDANNEISATDTTYTAGEGINIGPGDDYSAMQGPAPTGYHIPLNTEWQSIVDAGIILGAWSSHGGDDFRIKMKMPFAGYRNIWASKLSQGTDGLYWSANAYDTTSVYNLRFYTNNLNSRNDNNRVYGFPLRCFKDTPVVPDNNWTTIFDGNSIAIGAGIFHNSTLGLISISADGINRITIRDKNEGATVVYNDGDTLSESNCGKYYQWGNNYGFSWTGSVTTSSTQVDASGYGPGNYYSSSTFITGSDDWSSVGNDNLWGGMTGIIIHNNTITNTGVLSVNGQTGHVTVSAGEGNTKTFYLSGTSDLTTAQAIYDWYLAGKDPIIVYNDEVYTLGNNIDDKLIFYGNKTFPVNNTASSSGLLTHRLALSYSNQVVTSIDNNGVTESSRFLVTNYDYSIPYTPQYSGSPTTKKYVDDGDTYIGSSAPSSPVEGKLWYDTTNDVLKAYDGTNWISTGGSFSQVQADWNQSTTTAVDYIKNKPNLSTVATSGSYNDLLNKPTIPAAQIQSDWNQTNTSSADYIKNKPTIPAAQVQANWNQTTTTAVDYIKNKPTIPTVNNATLTIQKNGTTIDTFTANASSNKTVNITVPTKTSELTNDSSFIGWDASTEYYSAGINPNYYTKTITSSLTRMIRLEGKGYVGSYPGDVGFDFTITLQKVSAGYQAAAIWKSCISGKFYVDGYSQLISNPTQYDTIGYIPVGGGWGEELYVRFYPYGNGEILMKMDSGISDPISVHISQTTLFSV